MKILFITANRLGDAVLSTGLLSYLMDRFPAARFTVVAGPVAAPLFHAAPRIERVIALEKRPRSLHWVGLWRRCVGTRWHAVVDLRRSLIRWTLRARDRRAMPKANPAMHRVRLIAATFGLESDPPSPTLWTRPDDEEKARCLIPDGSPVLAIAPAANWRGKQWRAERFAALVVRLTATDGLLPEARVAVFAADNERDQATPVLDAVPQHRRIDLVGGLDLTCVGACLARCALFIGNDSGLMHMAAAVGMPTLGLFGPSRPEHYAPWGPHGAWVRTERSYEELTGAPGYDHRTTDTLMDSLSVEAVERAAVELWQRTARSAA